MRPVIMDTGPLVAWFCPRDIHHQWALGTFDKLLAGAVVCEPVLTETRHLVAKAGMPPAAVLRLVESNDLRLVSHVGETLAIRTLMERYADVPMDFADACVTRLAELHDTLPVCTIDSDFSVFRKNGREVIESIAPFSN